MSSSEQRLRERPTAEEDMESLLLVWVAAFLLALAAVVCSPTLRGVLGGVGVLGVAGATAVVLISSVHPRVGMDFVLISPVGAMLAAVGLGLSVGMPFALLLEAMPVAGRMLDTLRGSQQVEALLPHLESRGSVLESVQSLIIVTWIMESGAYERAIELLCDRFQSFGAAGPSAGLELLPIMALFSEAFLQSMLTVAPAVVLFGCLELFAMLLSRIEPRSGVVTELVDLKLLLGIAVAALLLAQMSAA